MKALLAILFFPLMLSCSKQKVNDYNNKIIGNWNIVGINTFGKLADGIKIEKGTFSFGENRTLTYSPANNMGDQSYAGTWDIAVSRDYNTDANSQPNYVLTINIGNNADPLTEHLEIVDFSNQSQFTARIYRLSNDVVYKFERR